MATDRLPAADLAFVFFFHSPASVITAIPLKPAARIIGMNPAFALPFRQRLAGVDAEEIEAAIAFSFGEFGVLEPAPGKFTPAIGHVLSAEHAKPKHLRG